MFSRTLSLFGLVLAAVSSAAVLADVPVAPRLSLLKQGQPAQQAQPVQQGQPVQAATQQQNGKPADDQASGDQIDQMKDSAAHSARVLIKSIDAAQGQEATLGKRLGNMGDALEDARAVGASAKHQIAALEATLGTAKEAAASCLALTAGMKDEIAEEKQKAAQIEDHSAENEAKLQQARQAAAELQKAVAERAQQLEELRNNQRLAKKLARKLEDVNAAKEALANKLAKFKEDMGNNIERVNADTMALREQMKAMELKLQHAAQAAKILQPYAEE